MLRKFRYLGFSESQISQAVSKNQRIGSFWKSLKWRLVKNRDGLTTILTEERDNDNLQVNIGAVGEYFFGDYRIDIEILDIEKITCLSLAQFTASTSQISDQEVSL